MKIGVGSTKVIGKITTAIEIENKEHNINIYVIDKLVESLIIGYEDAIRL